MLVITGWNSQIAIELRKTLEGQGGELADLYEGRIIRATYDAMPLDADRYFFCAGYLVGKSIAQQSTEEFMTTFEVNALEPIKACEFIFASNTRARVCVMGSESGISGSFDEAYSVAKAELHKYVEGKRLGPEQQLVAIAPGIIEDAGMTVRRDDRTNLNARRESHPKGRFVTSHEVAALVRFLLYEDRGYICNTVIRMNGGEHIR